MTAEPATYDNRTVCRSTPSSHVHAAIERNCPAADLRQCLTGPALKSEAVVYYSTRGAVDECGGGLDCQLLPPGSAWPGAIGACDTSVVKKIAQARLETLNLRLTDRCAPRSKMQREFATVPPEAPPVAMVFASVAVRGRSSTR